jgi:P27 family predicted phage terminase small subunit
MSGQRQKAPGLLANGRGGRGRALTVIANQNRVVPRAPADISPYARGRWRRFFLSWVADAVNMEADAEALTHWILCVDERAKLRKMASDNPLIKGSHGQLMQNPLRRTVRELSREIARAEDHFGMTALSRWRLQLTASEAKRSANDLPKDLMADMSEVISVNEL